MNRTSVWIACLLALTTQCSQAQDRPVDAYSAVDVKGLVDVSLHTGYRKPQLSLDGSEGALARVKTMVVNGTLYIVNQGGPIHADVKGQVIKEFHYHGMGSIVGTHLYTHGLYADIANEGNTRLAGTLGIRDLRVAGSGMTQISGITGNYLAVHTEKGAKVKLSGNVNLAELDLAGGGWLNLYWVTSDNLTIRARDGTKIQLGGVVNKLDVELWGNARFNGRYLRAERSFVKTHNRSVAEIFSIHHQSTLATDASDIFYYTLPLTRADFMAFNGAVLDMRDLSLPYVQEYHRYNRQFP